MFLLIIIFAIRNNTISAVKRIFAIIVSVATFTSVLFANGDPVMRYSSLNRVGNPEPLSVSEIRIKSENLVITHLEGYNCFDVTYKLENSSDKNFPDLNYGFPIDYSTGDEAETYNVLPDGYSESMEEVGWNKRLIKGVEFILNGKKLPFTVSKESVREAYIDTEIDSVLIPATNRRWFYTELSIKSNSVATLQVKYKVYANSVNFLGSECLCNYDYERKLCVEDGRRLCTLTYPSFFSRYFSHKFRILYDFTPAKHFGNGEPFPLHVCINLSALKNPSIRSYDNDYGNKDLTQFFYKNAANIKPLDLTVFHTADYSPLRIELLKKQFEIPPGDYDVKVRQKTVVVDFKKPRFVTEVGYAPGTKLPDEFCCQVTFADGRTDKFRYSKQDDKYCRDTPKFDMLVLTIFQDSERYYEVCDGDRYKYEFEQRDINGDSFKVWKIEFTFPGEQYAQGFTHLTPIDARF